MQLFYRKCKMYFMADTKARCIDSFCTTRNTQILHDKPTTRSRFFFKSFSLKTFNCTHIPISKSDFHFILLLHFLLYFPLYKLALFSSFQILFLVSIQMEIAFQKQIKAKAYVEEICTLRIKKMVKKDS